MSSSLLFQQCPGCLVHFIWKVLEMGGRWPYSCCFVGCCFQDLFDIVHSILVQLLPSFFSLHLVFWIYYLDQLLSSSIIRG